MPLVYTDPITAALAALEAGDHHAAHLVLADAFDRDPRETELARLANLILPCRMIAAATDGLRRAHYRRNQPADADLGCVTPVPSMESVFYQRKTGVANN